MKRTALYVFFCMLFAMAATMYVMKPMMALAQDGSGDDYNYDDWEDEEAEEDPFGGILYPIFPSIEDVKVDPAAPAAGQDVTVSAKIGLIMEDEDEEATVAEASIEYVVGGKTATVPMTASGGVYTGKIPGQPAGSKVQFAVVAKDSFGNVSRELICNGQLGAGASDMDNDGELVPDDMDILTTSVGCDGENILVGFTVQGKVNGGTVDPPYIHLYGVKFTNPATDEGEGLMIGKLMANIPSAKEAGEKVKAAGLTDGFLVPPFGILDINKAQTTPTILDAMMKDAGEKIVKSEGGVFQASLKKSALGDLAAGYFRMIVITVANASIETFMPIPLNATPYTQVYDRQHEYAVK